MNAASSRSHVVFTIKIHLLEGKRPAANEADMRKVTTSKINVADLAGSERQAKTGAEGTRLKEGCSINQSLSALAHIIHELSENASKEQAYKTKVAFRASKLTFLLKDSLAGNSRSFMVACVSPSYFNLPETLSTLRFATSVKKIKTKAVQNVLAARSEVEQALREEIKELQRQLEEAKLAAAGYDDMEHLEGMLAYATGCESRERKSVQRHETNESLVDQANEQTPYLMNMSDDPLMAGCLMYYLFEGRKITCGAAHNNTLCLQGVGISDLLCQVTCTDKNEVTIEKLSEDGRVNVSGKLLAVGCPKTLRHHDTIYLGRSMALKFVVPDEAQFGGDDPSEDIREHRRRFSSLHGLEDEWLAMDECPNWLSLQEYFSKIAVHLPVPQAQQLGEDMKRAWTLCEEANELTRECRASEGLAFEIDLTSTIPSSVVIRVLQTAPTGYDESEEKAPLYLWSLPQMSERLERMRDFYEEILLNGSLEVDPLLDPWHEPQQGAIELRLAELEVLYKAQQELINSMKSKTRRTVQLWSEGDPGSSLRNCFNAWKESMPSKTKNPKWKATFKAKPSPSGRSASNPNVASPRHAPGVGKRRLTVNINSLAKSSLSAPASRSNISFAAVPSSLSTTSKNRRPPSKISTSDSPEQKSQALPKDQEPATIYNQEEDVADDTEGVTPQFTSQGVGTDDSMLESASPKQDESPAVGQVAGSSESDQVLRKELEEVWRLCDALTKQMQDYRRDATYPLQPVSPPSPAIVLSPGLEAVSPGGSHSPLQAQFMPARYVGTTYMPVQPPVVKVCSPHSVPSTPNTVVRPSPATVAPLIGAGYPIAISAVAAAALAQTKTTL